MTDTSMSLELDALYSYTFEGSDLFNNGHTIEARINCGPLPEATGLALGGLYFRFEQIHFHWGKTNVTGTEHAINGNKHSMEVNSIFNLIN